MSTFTVMNHDFSATWKKMVPFLNSGKPIGNHFLWWRDETTQKLYETAQKAIYAFICKLCNQGAFKVGLHTKIRALDDEHEVNGDIAGSPHSQDMKNEIDGFLSQLQDASYGSAHHCPNCSCSAFNNTPTQRQMQIVNAQVSSIHKLAQKYMTTGIGPGWLFCAKVWPF